MIDLIYVLTEPHKTYNRIVFFRSFHKILLFKQHEIGIITTLYTFSISHEKFLAKSV